MIKGVNKQIIEIKCPKDERFEKILLFVNAEKCPDDREQISEKAKLIAKTFLADRKRKRNHPLRKCLREHAAAAGILAAGLLGLAAAAAVYVV